jgi:two-component system response regulator AtoC
MMASTPTLGRDIGQTSLADRIQGMSTILIAEHDSPLRQQLAQFFQESGYQVAEACNRTEALQKLTHARFDLLLTELRFPEHSGLDLLHPAPCHDDPPAVLVLCGPEEAAHAAQALTLGAQDYLVKQIPFNLTEARIRAERVLERHRLARDVQYLRHVQPYVCDYEAIIGQSSHLHKLLVHLRRDLATDSPVLLTGEAGTGKLWFAAAIHAQSPRHHHAFVMVNCAGLSEQHLEIELFGHEPGAFPGAVGRRIGGFEQAHLGTLVLDHVGDLNPRLQSKLIRVIQEQQFSRLGSSQKGDVDVRVISTVDRSLAKAVRNGWFRADLYTHLNAINVKLPALRECPEDILPLGRAFLRQYNRLCGRRVQGFDPEIERALVAYAWPGNLHELAATIAQGVLREAGEVMRLSSLGMGESVPAPREGQSRLVNLPPHGASLRDIEREALLQALHRADWVQKTAAARLDISPRVMHYKLKTHGITHPRWARRR